MMSAEMADGHIARYKEMGDAMKSLISELGDHNTSPARKGALEHAIFGAVDALVHDIGVFINQLAMESK